MKTTLLFRGAAFAAVLAAGACVTKSSKDTIYDGLLKLGLTENGAGCFVGELDDRLDRSELNAVAGLLDAAREREGFFSAVREAGDPQVVSAVASATFSCLFSG